jgi:hypothetical protein
MMNDEEFEQRLREMARPLKVNDPTREWKAQMLATARAGATSGRENEGRRSPWMVAMLLGVWLLIALMRMTTPGDGLRGVEGGEGVSKSDHVKVGPADETTSFSLLAARVQLQLLDLP